MASKVQVEDKELTNADLLAGGRKEGQHDQVNGMLPSLDEHTDDKSGDHLHAKLCASSSSNRPERYEHIIIKIDE